MIKKLYKKYKRRFCWRKLDSKFKNLFKDIGISPEQLEAKEKKERLEKVSRETLKRNIKNREAVKETLETIASQLEDINN